MKLFQMLIFTATMFSNIRWQWTPNGYLASLVAIGVTFAATCALLWVGNRLRQLKARRGRGKQRLYQGALPPALPNWHGSRSRNLLG